jgi:L-seryl-tRNA(Ser) seleniumtransferase
VLAIATGPFRNSLEAYVNQTIVGDAPRARPATTPTDRFGNPLDPVVRYARGQVLKGSDDEVKRMLRARHIVGELVRRTGKESIFDLSGMNRGSGITVEDVPHLSSHVPFFAQFEGKTEPLALKHMGANPAQHAALILNRVSAANFIALTTLLKPGDAVFAFAPTGGASHPSTVRPIAMAGARLTEFHTFAELEAAWRTEGAPRLLLVTPISASKRHIPFEDFQRALALPRGSQTLAYVDDAHMASRIAFFDEPPTFQVGKVDLAVCSADKHIAGPRAGVMVGRRDLVTLIASRAYELGLEAQAGQYVGVGNALRNFDPGAVKEAGKLATGLVKLLQQKYGAERPYLGGPGVSISGDDALAIALELRGKAVKPRLVAVEAAGLIAMKMIEQDHILTICAVAMPGSAPAVRLMMYPDGPRLGLERIVASIERGIGRLSEVVDDVEAARAQLLGD